MSKRFEELDSVRGLAAISVMLLHFFLAFKVCVPDFNLISVVDRSPLRIFWSGTEAVILFFVLSGFVLSMSYYNTVTLKYKDYLIRRICRIYLPYIVSVFLTVVCMATLYRENVPSISGWFDLFKSSSTDLLLGHVILIDQFDSYKLNVVFWSLVHEMRISIIFPILMLIILKLSWKRNLIIAALCSICFFIIYFFSLKFLQNDITKNSTSYFATIRYIPFFILGALMAKYRNILDGFYNKFTTSSKILMLIVAVLSYTYPWWFLINITYLHVSFINDMMVSLGCTIFIATSIFSKRVRGVLLLKPIHFIGRISYSLYLVHMVVLLSILNAFYGKASIGLIFVSAFVLSFFVAVVMHYLVEIPSISLGRILTRKNKNKLLTGVLETQQSRVVTEINTR